MEKTYMKTLVYILGSGGSGKSTLSRAILNYNVIAAPDDYTGIVEIEATVPATIRGIAGKEKARYVVSRQAKVALAGNWKNGTDSIKAIDALPHVLELCWKECDTVIVDPVRCSKKFVDWMANYPEPLAALFVYLNLTEATNTDRLLKRRNMNSKNNEKESVLPEKTYNNMLAFRERASGVYAYACNEYKRFPKLCLVIPEQFSPAESAAAIYKSLDFLKNNPSEVTGLFHPILFHSFGKE